VPCTAVSEVTESLRWRCAERIDIFRALVGHPQGDIGLNVSAVLRWSKGVLVACLARLQTSVLS
jgi:hypothetical protein